MFEPRYLTGPALMVVGFLLLYVSWQIWRVHPVNRVFILGPLVTEAGMIALLHQRLLFLAFGLLMTESGIYRCVYWYVDPRVNAPSVMFLGAMETVFSLWSAYLAVNAGFKLWRAR